jgi:uncharacterized membrane protein
MSTPLLMLALMVAPWLLVRTGMAFGRTSPDPAAAAAVGLGLLFLFTASGHFVRTDEMVRMLPAWVPARQPLIYLSGVLEVLIGLAFFVPAWRGLAGAAAATVLVAFFPANIYAAFEHVPMGGHAWGPVYLWIRAPLQLAILAWVYRFTLRRSSLDVFGHHRQRLLER